MPTLSRIKETLESVYFVHFLLSFGSMKDQAAARHCFSRRLSIGRKPIKETKRQTQILGAVIMHLLVS